MFYEAPKDELLHTITHSEHMNKFMGEIYSHAYFVHNIFLIHMFFGFLFASCLSFDLHIFYKLIIVNVVQIYKL